MLCANAVTGGDLRSFNHFALKMCGLRRAERKRVIRRLNALLKHSGHSIADEGSGEEEGGDAAAHGERERAEPEETEPEGKGTGVKREGGDERRDGGDSKMVDAHSIGNRD